MSLQKLTRRVKSVITETFSDPEEKRKKLNNTVFANTEVDLESVENVPREVVQEFVRIVSFLFLFLKKLPLRYDILYLSDCYHYVLYGMIPTFARVCVYEPLFTSFLASW